MTVTPTTCAAPGCDNPVPSRRGPGRPFLYCSPSCRPSFHHSTIAVELIHPDTSPDGRPVERVWSVRLRRGQHVVVLADHLGWPSASALAEQLNQLLKPHAIKKGGAIG